MARMEADGITDVRVLPTHLLYGDEFDKMHAQLNAAAGRFSSVVTAVPLLSCDEDLRTVLQAVAAGFS